MASLRVGASCPGTRFSCQIVRCVVVAIIATVPGRGLGLMSDLFFSFPVASVNILCKAAQVLELSWFAYTVRQTSIKLVTKGSITIALELRREAVELHDVANNLLHVLHLQVVELVLSISDGVVQAKLELKI